MKLRLFALVSTLIVLPAFVVVRDAADRSPTCKRVSAWTTAHAGSLPTTLDALEAYPEAQRRSIFGALAVETKAEILRAHLLTFRNLDQTFIDRAIAQITPEVLGDVARRREVATNLAMEAITLFGKEGARPIVATVGGAVRPTRSLAALRVYLSDALRNTFTAAASTFGNCQCASDDWFEWCNSPYYVCVANQWCDQTSWCGTLWLNTCDGMCEEQYGPYDPRRR